MAINSVEELTIPESLSKRGIKEPSQELDRDTFMKLLVAELKNQDPTDPLNAREMVTQLSQLSSVERLTAIEAGVANMQAETAGLASTQVSSLVGRMVTADASSMALGMLGSTEGTFSLSEPASSVDVAIYSGDGRLVRTLPLGEQHPGNNRFLWDGFDSEGVRVEAGRYQMSVTARDMQGNPITAATSLSGRVTEVHYDNGVPELMVGQSKVLFSDVTSIAQ